MKNCNRFLGLFFMLFVIAFFSSCSSDDGAPEPPVVATPTPDPTPTPTSADRRETFTFTSNGISIEAKIFIPSEYDENKNLPAIYLLDFKEQHFQVATDEFDKVIEGVKGVQGLNALVITLAEHMDIDFVIPRDYQEYNDVYKNMAAYVDDNYTSNSSRTFIARGSEASQVLMTLFLEEKETSVFQNFIATDSPSVGLVTAMLENEDFPQEKENKKLHFSFSSTNDYDLNIKLINTINEQAYPWLEFRSVEYPNLTYENAYPTAFANGIKFVFED
ncbi:MAG: hypothetical protein WBM53_13720 [Maribacter sp.]